MTLSPAQLASLLTNLKLFLPSVDWAPGKSWDEEDKPYIFVNECGCYSAFDNEPASLTLFLQGDLTNASYNITTRLQNAAKNWARSNLMKASLTLFLQGDLTNASYNITTRLQNAAKNWARSNLMYITCPA